ncbi:unnamed protein product [Rotaria sp. Silwood2]|nr:unnamed protein product [Rotaria sp. Silwood2]
MGLLLDCFRGSNSEQSSHSENVITPDMDTRRQTAAEAANRRIQQNERRGVDEDELRRMKQRQSERERIEQQQTKLPRETNDNGGLRYVSRPFWPYQYHHHLNVSTHMSSNSQIREISPMRLSPTMNIDILNVYRDCPFCLKLLFEPISTLCGHTFCLLCMERFILTSERILQCPICRDDLNYLRSSSSHLKANAILHNLFRQQYEKEYEIRRIETENERKQIIKKRLIVGNTHQLLSCDYDYTRHEWTLFVKLNNDDQDDISQYIKQVTINLHPTFTPSQIILDKPPFCLTRIGWGVFTIYLTIEFHSQWKKSDFRTSWFLSFSNTGNQKTIEIEFQKTTDDINNEEMLHLLITSGAALQALIPPLTNSKEWIIVCKLKYSKRNTKQPSIHGRFI